MSKGSGIAGGLFWKFLEQGASQLVQFIVSVLLARLLGPEQYGVVVLILVFVNMLALFVQNGFATALIQKKDSTKTDFNSVLYFNIVLGILLYILIYFVAPFISAFYKDEHITLLTRLTALILIPAGVIAVQNAYIASRMEFSKLFIAIFLTAVISGSISVYMAYKGFGVYALVAQQLLYYSLLCIILLCILSWKPALEFKFSSIKSLSSFGLRMLLAAAIDNTFNNIHSLVMGKTFNKAVLANFNRGEQFPKLIVANLGASIQAVMLPVMSKVQDESQKVREMLKQAISISCYVVFPMMFGMIAMSDTIIILFLGKAWEQAVVYLILMSLAYALWSIHIVNLQTISALGRSDIFLKIEVIKKIVSLSLLLLGIYLKDVFIFVLLKVVADFIAAFINSYPNSKLLDFGPLKQFVKVLPSLIISAIMAAAVYAVGRFLAIGVLRLICQLITGVLAYIILSIISRNKDFLFLYSLYKNTVKKA